MSRRRWRLREPDRAVVDALAQNLAVSRLLAELVVNRGITEPVAAGLFLSPSLAELHDPFLLLGMEPAVLRLCAAVEKGERICVYGDYDVDGITATALLIAVFRDLSVDSVYYLPKRLEHGYGLSREGMEAVAALGADVLVTVDCGITATEEALLCRSLGIDLIITDHHTPGPVIPDACAVINPHQPGCSFPFKSLAGVGVAFNLLIALRQRLRQLGRFTSCAEPDLRAYLDLVALGTIADIVPLVDENRIFVRYGLERLSNGVRTGVKALKTAAAVTGPVTCGAVGFRLAPRLNAAGRLEDAALGVELLLSSDPDEAGKMAALLEVSNRERQQLEQDILTDALEKMRVSPQSSGRKSIVLASSEWHPGVIGIVASRIVDLYHRPTILIAFQDGNGRGSGRSIPGFNLHDALHACSDHLLKFGGHRYAAGLSIEEEVLDRFVDNFDEIAQGLLSDADLVPDLIIDSELSPEQVTFNLADHLERLTPFGMGNPEPVFLLRGVSVVEKRILKERHVKLRLAAGGSSFQAIGFNMALKPLPALIDLVFSIENDSWNGKRRLQLRIRDFKEAGCEALGAPVELYRAAETELSDDIFV